jgi:hypothetical protein
MLADGPGADIHHMSARARVTAVALTALTTLALPVGATAWAGEAGLPSDRPARGLVFEGLAPAEPGGACDAASGDGPLLEIRERGRLLGCTHGPDPAPAGVALGGTPSTAELRAPATLGTGGVPCVGDGASGFRVQAVYAHPLGQPDRYDAVAPLIEGWAASNVDSVFAASAAETGQGRQVRFVTDAACRLAIAHVTLSTKGADTFSATIAELRKQGFGRSDRKYLVWMDAPGPYCGIAQQYLDDAPGPTNLNDGSPSVPGMVARIDAPCWGGTGTPVEAHELMHTLGGVQSSAPHATGNGHCTDEAEVMCYDDDGAGPQTTVPTCPATHERLFDCGHDDYFHTAPPPGSYLATHWNAATSRFLEVAPLGGSGTGPAKIVHLKASRARVRAGSKVRLTASLEPCGQAIGGMVVLRSKGHVWMRPVAPTCTATFRVRVATRTRFRAVSPAQGEDGVTAVSGTVTVRTSRS